MPATSPAGCLFERPFVQPSEGVPSAAADGTKVPVVPAELGPGQSPTGLASATRRPDRSRLGDCRIGSPPDGVPRTAPPTVEAGRPEPAASLTRYRPESAAAISS